MSGHDASPQVGKGSRGHTELSHELMEAVYSHPWASTLALRIVLFVIRDSYGWKRKDTMPYSFPQLAEAIGGAERSAVFKAVRYLKAEGVIVDAPGGGFALIKNYNAWGNTPELPLPIASVANRQPLPTGNASPLPTGTETVPTGNNSLPTGNLYRRKKGKKEIKGDSSVEKVNNGTDTPRQRAKLGDPERPPDEHPNFKLLPFKLREELTDQWKEARDKARKKNECRRKCGRERASEAWPYCRPCTVCHICQKPADGTRTFQNGPPGITCTKCAEKIAEEF